MTDTPNETLTEFIKRILRQKGLSLHDVERNSEKAITSSYLSKIINGKINSIGVEIIVGLAKGLDVDPFDVFAAVLGRTSREGEVSSSLLIDIMQKVVADPQLVNVIQKWPKLSVKGRAVLLQYMEALSEPTPQKKSRKKKKK
jgi:transcriptional regulator with XRE-family HTH domain